MKLNFGWVTDLFTNVIAIEGIIFNDKGHLIVAHADQIPLSELFMQGHMH